MTPYVYSYYLQFRKQEGVTVKWYSLVANNVEWYSYSSRMEPSNLSSSRKIPSDTITHEGQIRVMPTRQSYLISSGSVTTSLTLLCYSTKQHITMRIAQSKKWELWSLLPKFRLTHEYTGYDYSMSLHSWGVNLQAGNVIARLLQVVELLKYWQIEAQDFAGWF